MALRQFVESRTASAIRFEFSGEDSSSDRLDDTVAYELFRIGREAITNAYYHSQCTAVRVIWEHIGSEIRLAVEDNGVGLSDAQNSSAGIGRSVMEYRARTIGGALRYTNVDGGGLRVDPDVPCLNPETRADTDQTRAAAPNQADPSRLTQFGANLGECNVTQMPRAADVGTSVGTILLLTSGVFEIQLVAPCIGFPPWPPINQRDACDRLDRTVRRFGRKIQISKGCAARGHSMLTGSAVRVAPLRRTKAPSESPRGSNTSLAESRCYMRSWRLDPSRWR